MVWCFLGIVRATESICEMKVPLFKWSSWGLWLFLIWPKLTQKAILTKRGCINKTAQISIQMRCVYQGTNVRTVNTNLRMKQSAQKVIKLRAVGWHVTKNVKRWSFTLTPLWGVFTHLWDCESTERPERQKSPSSKNIGGLGAQNDVWVRIIRWAEMWRGQIGSCPQLKKKHRPTTLVGGSTEQPHGRGSPSGWGEGAWGAIHGKPWRGGGRPAPGCRRRRWQARGSKEPLWCSEHRMNCRRTSV